MFPNLEFELASVLYSVISVAPSAVLLVVSRFVEVSQSTPVQGSSVQGWVQRISKNFNSQFSIDLL